MCLNHGIKGDVCFFTLLASPDGIRDGLWKKGGGGGCSSGRESAEEKAEKEELEG